MAPILALATLALLMAAPGQAASAFQLPETLSISWDGATAQRFSLDFQRAADLVKSVKPVTVAADEVSADADEAEGDEADEETAPQGGEGGGQKAPDAGAEGRDYRVQGAGGPGDGRLTLHSPHFGETVEVVYRTPDGRYDEDGLAQIRRLFRCKLTGEVVEIPVELIELLDAIQDHFGADVVELICGYRSAQRNEKMRKKSSGVAKNSLHVKGWAADIYVPGVTLKQLRDFAASLKAGGVGYYPSSGFVHVDVGRVRYW